MTSRPVVVAVDGSEESLRAAEWAAIAARKLRATLRIVSVPAAPPRLYAVEVSEEMAASALRGLAARALDSAIQRVRALGSDLDVDTCLLRGAPPFAVAEAATGAAMLVVGARGAGGFGSMTLGSVSRYASAHAPCPVVVVREPPTAVRDEIVVGIEDVEQSSDALAPWREKYPGVPIRSEIVHGHAAWVMASCTARAELVVLGRQPAGRGSGIASIRQAVLSHACGPVAIVPVSS